MPGSPDGIRAAIGPVGSRTPGILADPTRPQRGGPIA